MNKFSSDYHYVTPSPWPLLGSFGVLMMMSGLMKMFYFKDYYYFLSMLLLSLMIFFQWWRDVVRESEFQGAHTDQVMWMLRGSFMLFILSEIFFFISFFWSYFHMMLSPPLEGGGYWPPSGIIPFDPFSIPMLNSFILVTSGMTATVSHYMMVQNNSSMKYYLLLTIILGFIFTGFQGLEYLDSVFTISDSVYGSTFFMMTGFHGLHVMVGSLFLFYCFLRMMLNHFRADHHLGFEFSLWYWHFVDVIWLFLYIIVYWWSY